MALRSLALLIVALAMTACVGDAIQQSHIDGNVPPPADFHITERIKAKAGIR
jgi:hypothetical protein